jgi:hypothetical protein
MEDIRVLEGVSRRYHQLDEKIAEKGGLANFFGLYGRIMEILDLTSPNELDALINEIQRARETLEQLQEMVTEIRALKEIFATAKSRVAPGNQKT